MKFRIALLLTQIRDLCRRILGPPRHGEDPYAGVRVPIKRGPRGRRSGMAVMEPDEGDYFSETVQSRSRTIPAVMTANPPQKIAKEGRRPDDP